MKIFWSVLFLMFALPVSAVELSEPDNSFILLDIDNPSAQETYYGELSNFPHTYQFHVDQPLEFYAQVATAGKSTDNPELSLILVKAERRGVSEVDRKRAEDIQWTKNYDSSLGVSFMEGETLTATLEEGVYKLEVSTPENRSGYQLKINGGSTPSYRELFMARSVFNAGWLSLLLVWRIYVPLLFLGALWWYWRKRRKQQHA